MILKKKNKFSQFAALAIVLMMGANYANALDLVGAFTHAQDIDPKFQAAKSQNKVTTSQALSDRLSYLPSFSYNRQQLPNFSSTTSTSAMTQPIFNLQALGQVAQGGPTYTLAKASLDAASQDLATRTVNAVVQIVLANETIRANQAQIAALESQAQGAKRKYELGQGTVTDMLDVQVRFEQAKANDLTLRANLQAAQDQFYAITGQYPATNDFILPYRHEKFSMNSLAAILEKVAKDNPSIVSAKANESLAKYNVAISASNWTPTLGYTLSKSNYAGTQTINNGLTLTVPINASNFVNTLGSVAAYEKTTNDREAAETQAKLDAQRLYALVEAGQETVRIKAQASDIAKQSVVANQKSYEGGVKSTTDVLIAIGTQFQARVDYVQSVTQQGANLLNLLLVSAEDPVQAVQQTQAFLFRK